MFPKLSAKYNREGVSYHKIFNMYKSVAILILIITFVGAEDNLLVEMGEDSDAENVSEGVKMTPPLAEDTLSQQHHLDDTHVSPESVPEKKDQVGVEAKKEDHARDSNEEKEAMETKINEKTDEEETQAGQEGLTSISTDDFDAESESADSEMNYSTPKSTEAQQHLTINPSESVSNKEDEAKMETINDKDYESSEETKRQREEISDDTESDSNKEDEAKMETINHKDYESSEETKTLRGEINDDTGEKEEVSMHCLDCLCKFATDCNMERQCEEPISIFGLGKGFDKGDCGPFHISFPFWADANNVTLEIGDAKMENEWRLCSLDLMCSTDAIQKYFRKYHHDCNGDGKVDCVDYAAIHTLGPFGCMVRSNLLSWNESRRKGLLQCMTSKEKGPYAKKMEELTAKLRLQDFAAWKLVEKEKKNSAVVEAKVQTNAVNPGGEVNAEEADAQEDFQ